MAVILTASVDIRLTGLIVDNSLLKSGLLQVQNKHLRSGLLKATTYPPPRPNQRYKRTLKNKLGWRITPAHIVNNSSIVGDVTNPITVDRRGRYYPKYIYGSETQGQRQAAVHRSRWPLERQLIDEQAFVRESEDAVFRAIKLRG